MIEDDQLRAGSRTQCGDFVDFAGAGEEGRVGTRALAAQNAGDADARALCELRELVGRFGVIRLAEIEADEHRLGAAPGTFKHSKDEERRSAVGSNGRSPD